MLFYEKWRVVLLQTTYCFEKVTCCFSSNDVSFTCCGTLGWWEKGEGWCDSCDTCDSKKSKTLLGCARVYTRGKDTYSIFVFDTVLSEPKGGFPLASCKVNKTTKSCLFDVVLWTVFFRIDVACSENFTFSSFFPSLVQYLPIYLQGDVSKLGNEEAYQDNKKLCEY